MLNKRSSTLLRHLMPVNLRPKFVVNVRSGFESVLNLDIISKKHENIPSLFSATNDGVYKSKQSNNSSESS